MTPEPLATKEDKYKHFPKGSNGFFTYFLITCADFLWLLKAIMPKIPKYITTLTSTTPI
jgi:hypothetical protein